MGTQETTAPDLGDEQWSHLLTCAVGGQHSFVKQPAIRTGKVLVIVSGSPGSSMPTWRRHSIRLIARAETSQILVRPLFPATPRVPGRRSGRSRGPGCQR
ncbi:hypothetical protein [Streptomyces tubercidicus]|uniref:hypothetical protein n=1 Tax=Streptomyces tubercidicus TaxID=47759 RepID=UPI002E0F89E1|nr:hypothetical protein OG761_16305 [Streptomyces tubercidicus]